jgi:(p)ppGpp synthase/HD superfamily hydrolase
MSEFIRGFSDERFSGVKIDMLEKSLEIALKAYAGKTDNAGKAYLLHPLRLMATMGKEEEIAMPLLHDAIEDPDYNAEDLLSNEYSKEHQANEAL